MARPRIAWLAVRATPYDLPLFERLLRHEELNVQMFFSRGGAPPPWARDQETIARCRAMTRSDVLGQSPPPRQILLALWREPWDLVVICGYGQVAMRIALLICMLRRIPFVVQGDTHLLRHRSWAKLLAKRLFLYPLLRSASAALGVGVLSKRYWESIGIPGDRVFIVPYSSHLEGFRQEAERSQGSRGSLRLQLGLAADDLVGLFVGRLVKTKGVDLLLRGLSAMNAGSRPHLLVVGDGPERESLGSMARAVQLPVTFLGFRENTGLPALFAAADFFVLPSREEPWGVVVSEAMACGLPVVLSDQVGAGYDLLADGQNGFLVRAESAEAWSEALMHCVRRRNDLAAMGSRARSVVESCTCSNAVDRVVDVIKGCLARKQDGGK